MSPYFFPLMRRMVLWTGSDGTYDAHVRVALHTVIILRSQSGLSIQ